MAEGDKKVTKLIAGEILVAQAQQRMKMSAVVENGMRNTLYMLMTLGGARETAVQLLVI